MKSRTFIALTLGIVLLFGQRALADTAAIQTNGQLPSGTCAAAGRDGDRSIAAVPLSDATGVGAIPGVVMISSASAEPKRSTPQRVRTDVAQLLGTGSVRTRPAEPQGSMSGSLLVFGSVMTGIGALGRRLAKPTA